MQRKIYVTGYKHFWMTAVYEDEILVDLFADEPETSGILDRIYIGKVKNIVKNIQAAFVDIGGVEGYYSLEENKNHIFTGKKNVNAPLVPGDEILVQVCRENLKTKAPALTSQISLAGKYMVLKGQKPSVGISSKITDVLEKQRLRQLFEKWTGDSFGFVVRTKAAGVSELALEQEMTALKTKYEDILKRSQYLKCFSEVYKEADEYIRRIADMEDENLVKVSTDIPEVYAQVKAHLHQTDVVFYEDTQMPLIKLLSLETKIERLMKPQVWLKSGGSIIISSTEAMVVIDVNTGKFVGKKKLEETYFLINMEAADEIARQLRLRNLSGIILIDFIDMKEDAQKEKLMAHLKSAVSKDPTKTVVVDMTKLNLVEMTRKKEKKPLHEQLGCICPTCKGRGYMY